MSPLRPRLLLVSIVLPTYNEAENIVPCIDAIDAVLGGILPYEVIVVDDGSPDGTARIVAELGHARPHVRLVERAAKRGLSSAVVDGFACARGDALVVMDADLQHDERILPEMLSRLAHADLAVGSRYVAGGSTGRWGARRAVLSRLGGRVCRAATGLDVSDLMSGFFAIRRDRYEQIAAKLRPRGFKILVEILSWMGRDEVVEVGYVFRPRARGQSKLTYAVGLEFLVSLYEIRFGRFLPRQFLRYALVGLSGVVVNVVALEILHLLLVPDAGALILAIGIAMVFNYVANDAFTFANTAPRGSRAGRLLRYLFFCSLGAGINFSVASTAHTYGLGLPLSALIGIAIAMVWNYETSRTLVWSADG